jgi:hypothetical protein
VLHKQKSQAIIDKTCFYRIHCEAHQYVQEQIVPLTLSGHTGAITRWESLLIIPRQQAATIQQ